MTNRIQLEGRYIPRSHDELEGIIEAGTFIERDERRREFILRGRDEDGTAWEAHLYSKDGRTFLGKMTSKGWDYVYSVEMELWVSPIDDQERLLVGTYHVIGDSPEEWCITLWPPEDD
jgi:hypothetical protein